MVKRYFLVMGLIMVVTGVQAASKYTVNNVTPFEMHVSWDFLGKSGDKMLVVAPGTKEEHNSPLLHKGFSHVYATNVKVGQLWGIDPESGDELRITNDM